MTAQPRALAEVTPFPLRCLRLARLTGHLATGLAIAWLRYPHLSTQRQRSIMSKWSRKLLTILGVTIQTGTPSRSMPARCMIVSNHISWVDIFVLAASYPATFVAKSEIRRWPLIGSLCARAGTLFIERGRHSSARHVNATIAASIEGGALVTIYPEGTTTDGLSLARFHAALFQPAIDARAVIQPVALRYAYPTGRYCGAPNYVGDTSFLASLWTITAARRIVAELNFLPPIDATGQERRALAAAAQSAIAGALGVPVPGIPPETGDDLPGESL